MWYLKDYLDNKKSNITIIRMAVSEGVSAIPTAEHPRKGRCALYVGQGESRVLPNTNQHQIVASPSPVNCKEFVPFHMRTGERKR